MRIKKIIALIETLALIGVTSVGFSSWVAVEEATQQATGSMNVENIVNNNKYLSIESFSFSDYYAVDSNNAGFFKDFVFDTNNLSSTGYLTFEIVVDISKYRNEVVSTNNFKFDVDLFSSSTIMNGAAGFVPLFDVTNESMSYTYSLSTTTGSTNYTPSANESATVVPSLGGDTISSTIYISNVDTTIRTMEIHMSYALDVTMNFYSFASAVSAMGGLDFNAVVTMEAN